MPENICHIEELDSTPTEAALLHLEVLNLQVLTDVEGEDLVRERGHRHLHTHNIRCSHHSLLTILVFKHKPQLNWGLSVK